MEVAPNKHFKRLVSRRRGAPAQQLRDPLRRGDQGRRGEIIELRCSHDPATLGANPEGRKVKGVIHWVSAAHALPAEVRLYDRLFTVPNPDQAGEGEFTAHLNPESLLTLTHCYLEPGLAEARPGEHFQFERQGYFCLDPNRATTCRCSTAP
jgi:glutaminyl-tRNA synthetase